MCPAHLIGKIDLGGKIYKSDFQFLDFSQHNCCNSAISWVILKKQSIYRFFGISSNFDIALWRHRNFDFLKRKIWKKIFDFF